ncbi:MAG TPA: ferredoxin-thioredoxin reductase catalytic domain-containing protein [Phycisphaerae bacterium]|nr:ferredoxin-thioredoxin reductase catalytic domain-containing protein [Phycisphaerae bacterium]HRY69790.1 ferredoxin-thioredoxin reductase catalytic domain-containing protein [Phycisphaerae bacterium]HSA25377.1 ferredoxin-thioredoxin reductase catalytic domain-containing protein [Phycisphaerae bacterium]
MSPSYEKNLRRLTKIAAETGLRLNPDEARAQKVVGLMAENYHAVGEWICPCKQQHKPAQKGMDKACPCPEWLDEIAKDGHCFCRLFFAQA